MKSDEKHQKPTHNQGVAGSIPAGATPRKSSTYKEICRCFFRWRCTRFALEDILLSRNLIFKKVCMLFAMLARRQGQQEDDK